MTARGRAIAFLLIMMTAVLASAEPPLLSLEIENSALRWQDEFLLTLSIYGPAEMELPPVSVDGLDQFKLQGTGKNLLQIPRGKTKRWILTYTLIAAEPGNFKIGPAILTHEGQTYRSNIVFLNVEGPASGKKTASPAVVQEQPKPPETKKTAPAEEKKKIEEKKKTPDPTATTKPPQQVKQQQQSPPQQKPVQQQQPPPQLKPVQQAKKPPVEPKKEETKQPVEEPKKIEKEEVKPAVVLSAAEIEDRIVILMEAKKTKPYRYQGIPVTVRLLSQLPVENLQFLEEADFPGFLRYDFPFTSKPKGEIVRYKNAEYASYDLVKFLLFPLEEGTIDISPVKCDLRVRVPSGAFPEADLRLNIQRSSNLLSVQVKPTPPGAIVGDFVLRNEVVSDQDDSKILRLVLEGKGQLSTYDFPGMNGKEFLSRKLSVVTSAKIEGEDLISRKIQDLEIVPQGTFTKVKLPEVKVHQFDPEAANLSLLKLPSLSLQFRPPGAKIKIKAPFPALTGNFLWILFVAATLLPVIVYFRNYRPVRKSSRGVRLQRLFSSKNLKLQISKNAARKLYQEIAAQIAKQGESSTIEESLKRHLPQEEWLNVNRSLRKLQQSAYSAQKPLPITYEEMKRCCEKIEALWVP